MNKIRVSLLDFIRTGTLKEIGVGSEMRACGELLGPPEAWEVKWDFYFPSLWYYGSVQISMEENEPGKVYVRAISIRSRSGRLDKIAGGRGLALSPDGVESCMRLEPFIALMESNGIEYEEVSSGYLTPGLSAYICLSGKTFAVFQSDEEDKSISWLYGVEAFDDQVTAKLLRAT